jgi:hypothetical protein
LITEYIYICDLIHQWECPVSIFNEKSIYQTSWVCCVKQNKPSPGLEFGRIIVLELPLLLLVANVTLLHEEFLLVGADC